MKNTPIGRLRGDLLLVSGEAERLYSQLVDGEQIDLFLIKQWLGDLQQSIALAEEIQEKERVA